MKPPDEEIHFVPEISFYRYWSKHGEETTEVNPSPVCRDNSRFCFRNK